VASSPMLVIGELQIAAALPGRREPRRRSDAMRRDGGRQRRHNDDE